MAKDLNDILKEQGDNAVKDMLLDMAKISDEELEAETAATDEAIKEKKAADETALAKDLIPEFMRMPREDMAFSDQLNTLHGDKIRWCTDAQSWYTYNNGVWQSQGNLNSCLLPYTRNVAKFIDFYRPPFPVKPDSLNAVIDLKDKAAVEQREKDELKYKQACARAVTGSKLAGKWQSRKVQFNAIELMKGIDRILIQQADLDNNPLLLNAGNGVVNLENGELLQAAPNLLLSRQCTAEYYPNAKSPVFDEFIKQILPNEGTRAAMLRYLGYCLTGLVNEEKVFFAYGKGGNGKGTLFGTIQHLLGNYATALKVGVLLKQKHGQNPNAADPEIAKLNNVRVAVVSEAKDVSRFDTATLKDMTGGDKITARAMYQQPMEFTPKFKLILQGNTLPTPENINDAGFWRRFFIIPFTQQFTGDAANTRLKQELLSPAVQQAILALLVKECLAWQKEGLIISDEMTEAITAYKGDIDFVANFINDNCVFDEGGSIRRKDFLERLRAAERISKAQYTDKDLDEMITAIDGITLEKPYPKAPLAFCGVKWLDSDSTEQAPPEDNDFEPSPPF